MKNEGACAPSGPPQNDAYAASNAPDWLSLKNLSRYTIIIADATHT